MKTLDQPEEILETRTIKNFSLKVNKFGSFKKKYPKCTTKVIDFVKVHTKTKKKGLRPLIISLFVIKRHTLIRFLFSGKELTLRSVSHLPD